WKNRKQPVLWLHGIPGCGKTVLSSSTTQDVEKSATREPCAVAYFYFDFNDVRKQSLDGALRSLIHQLSLQLGPSSELLRTFYRQHKDGQEQPLVEALQRCFKSMVAGAAYVRIILDALDESNTRRDLLRWIQSLHPSSHFQLLVTSRKEGDIESTLISCVQPEAIVPIQTDAVNADIKEYVGIRLREGKAFDRWRGRNEENEIEQMLVGKADGMYV
ncbi:hypothetical protein LTR22_027927, partial [Elasticomyces elasticus]